MSPTCFWPAGRRAPRNWRSGRRLAPAEAPGSPVVHRNRATDRVWHRRSHDPGRPGLAGVRPLCHPRPARLSEVTTDFRVFGIALLMAFTTALLLTAPSPPCAPDASICNRFCNRLAAPAPPVDAGARGGFWWQSKWPLSVVLLSGGGAAVRNAVAHAERPSRFPAGARALAVSIPVRGKSIDDSTRAALASGSVDEFAVACPAPKQPRSPSGTPLGGGVFP